MDIKPLIPYYFGFTMLRIYSSKDFYDHQQTLEVDPKCIQSVGWYVNHAGRAWAGPNATGSGSCVGTRVHDLPGKLQQ